MNDLISRAKLFNKLAAIKAPPEANEYKGEVYSVIQAMETADEGWKPVSDPPKENGFYLATVKYPSVPPDIYDLMYWDGEWSDTEDIIYTHVVTAWMKEPIPYGAERRCFGGNG